MRDLALSESSSPLLKGSSAVWASLGLLVGALAITVPVYGQWFSGVTEVGYKFGVPVLLAVFALAITTPRLRPLRAVLWSLCGVSLGFALAYLVARYPLIAESAWQGPRGAAAAKVFTEVVPVCAAILVSARLARLDLTSLALRGGRVRLSLGLGLLSTIPLWVAFAVDPKTGATAVLAVDRSTLLSWLPWIAVFSVGNGFMEELWFRGSWFASFSQLVGPSWAMHVTSFAFAVGHVIVYLPDIRSVVILGPIWLYMGYVYAAIVRKTGSLWGVVLAHAIADVIYMYIYFAT